MSRQFSRDFLLEVAKGNIPGHEIVSRSSRSPSVGTTPEDIWTVGGIRIFLTVDTALEVVSDDPNDTSAGSGARQVMVQGVQIDGTIVNQLVTMNGVTPVALGTSIARVNTMFVVNAGTYGSTTLGSNAGNIICRIPAGATQVEILVENTVPEALSQASHFAVPANKTAFILGFRLGVDTTKSATFILKLRRNYDIVVAPFTPAITVARFDGVVDLNVVEPFAPIGGSVQFPEKSDIWFVAFTSSGTASITVQYQLLLVDN